jgi:hypothetical protein
MQEWTVFTTISDLGLSFAHRTLLLPAIQRICRESRPRDIGKSPMTRSFGLTGPVSHIESREATLSETGPRPSTLMSSVATLDLVLFRAGTCGQQKHLVPRWISSILWISPDTVLASNLDEQCSGVIHQKKLHAHSIPSEQ